MIEEERVFQLGPLKLHSLVIGGEEWYLISSFIYEFNPKFSVAKFCSDKSSNLYLQIPKEWNSSYTKQYIFKKELLIELLSTIPIVSMFFIKHYFNERIVNIENNTMPERKMGRPKKSLGELKSVSQKRERRKIYEQKFEEENKISFLKFVNDFNIIDQLMKEQDTKLITKKLIKQNYSNKFLVKKKSRFELLVWKDENLISYDKIKSLRKDLHLQKFLPSKTSLHSFKNALNSLIIRRYDVVYKENAVVIENINQLLTDYVKFINQTKISLKWTSDGRRMKKNIGNIGVSFIVTNCDNIKTQAPENNIYIAIGNGEEDKSFFIENLTSFKYNLNKIMKDDIILIEDKELKNFFIADLKNMEYIHNTTDSNN